MAKKKLQDRIDDMPSLIKFVLFVAFSGIFIGSLYFVKDSIESTLRDFMPSNERESLVLQSELNLERVTLKRVVDGDTIIVFDESQNEIRVRLIGVDTAESVHPDESKNTTEGALASDYTKSQLSVGQTLYLEYDEERLDQYGRTLAYVWLDSNVDPTNLNDIQTKMYNAKLIVDGFAVTKQILPNIKYASIFESLDDN